MQTATIPTTTPAPALETTPLGVRHHDTWSPGDCEHQGDLILVCLPTLPASATPRENRQLADGDTRGSRHVLVGGEVFNADPSEVRLAISAATDGRVTVADPQYIGPVFRGVCLLEHPQHQHQSFPDHACTAVVYQRNLDAEEREQRASD